MEVEEELTEQEKRVIYELKAISHTTKEMLESLDKLVEITKEGGQLHSTQIAAIQSLQHTWKHLINQTTQNQNQHTQRQNSH